jgi:hypothetical protein
VADSIYYLLLIICSVNSTLLYQKTVILPV